MVHLYLFTKRIVMAVTRFITKQKLKIKILLTIYRITMSCFLFTFLINKTKQYSEVVFFYTFGSEFVVFNFNIFFPIYVCFISLIFLIYKKKNTYLYIYYNT